eukprot:GEMP01052435.1.p1 GENE.GEMP01052435.1~~GEMP01052435.1.p1  ORF type:complete len:253 (-),score=36.96 GEMP01052435.1:713-1471(-)
MLDLEEIPFGPWPLFDIVVATTSMSVLCVCVGFACTQWWIPSILRAKNIQNPPVTRGRSGAELLFIVLHNGLVALMSLVGFFFGSPQFALYTFCIEIGYEVFDSIALRHRLDPETVMHHMLSPMVMFFSMQTTVDVRVLLILCFGIDFSGAVLGLGKYILRYHRPKNPQRIYQIFSYVYFPCRIVIPGIATPLICMNLYHKEKWPSWSQNYVWAIFVLNALNVYFFVLICNRAKTANVHIQQLEDLESKQTQ